MLETRVKLNTATSNRRTFLQWSIFGLLTAVFAGLLNVVTRYLLPVPKSKIAEDLAIPVAQIPRGDSLIVKYKGSPVILIHTEEGFSAFDATCTHLGCLVKWIKNESIFYCPCHAGKFDSSGNVLAGPPPEPLLRIKTEVREDSIVFL